MIKLNQNGLYSRKQGVNVPCKYPKSWIKKQIDAREMRQIKDHNAEMEKKYGTYDLRGILNSDFYKVTPDDLRAKPGRPIRKITIEQFFEELQVDPSENNWYLTNKENLKSSKEIKVPYELLELTIDKIGQVQRHLTQQFAGTYNQFGMTKLTTHFYQKNANIPGGNIAFMILKNYFLETNAA